MRITQLTRSDFLLRAAGTGGAALASGAAAGWLAAPALGAASEQDLAWVRFGVAVEFVSAEYYRRARRTGFFSPEEARALQRATAAQLAHYRQFRQTLIDNADAPIEPADLEVTFPDGAFTTRAGTLGLRRIQGLMLHAYLGAVTTIQDQGIRKLFAQVSASEAGQLTLLTGLVKPVVDDPFPSVHGLATAADEFARYLP